MNVGVVVNPIAGMGGRVGLKGTDGKVDAARERGAAPRAPGRAVEALRSLQRRSDAVTVVAGPGQMGETEANEAGLETVAVGDVAPSATEPPATTTAADTRTVVEAIVDHGVDVLLFVGGDGTAVDVAETLDALDNDTPMLGVPAGVKVYSSVFAVTPKEAGRIVVEFDRTEDREINDIDEDAYRGGEVETELRAVRPVPVAEGLQSSKQLGGGSVEAVARGVLSDIEPGVTYVFAPGSTVGEIQDELGIDGSPLGVDVWRAGVDDPIEDGELLVRDGTGDEIEAALGDRNIIVVSPIGGQGFVFGRGNHQITPTTIRQSELSIVASRRKLDEIGVLRVDTDDQELNEELAGWHRVRVGQFEQRLMKLV